MKRGRVGRRRVRRSRYSSLIGSAAKLAYRGYRSFTRGKSGNSSQPLAVTNQYDAKTLYRRKRFSRRKFKRRRASYKAFRRNYISTLGCNQFVKTGTQDVASILNQQVVTSFWFLGLGAADPHKDLLTLSTSIATAGTAANWRKNETIYVKRAVCDVTLYNQTTGVTADIDVYTIRIRKSGILGNSLDNAFTTALTSQQKPDGSGATALTTTTYGTTPFQAPQWCEYFTVLSKKKFLISTDQTVHFQIKQGFRAINLEQTSEYSYLRGMIGVMIIFNGVYKSSVAGFPAVTLGVTYQRTYNVKYISEGDDRVNSL